MKSDSMVGFGRTGLIVIAIFALGWIMGYATGYIKGKDTLVNEIQPRVHVHE